MYTKWHTVDNPSEIVIRDEDHRTVARINNNHPNFSANAHLIAAAPEMYKVLGFVANQIVAWTDFRPELTPYTKLAIKAIDEVRAKVEGDK